MQVIPEGQFVYGIQLPVQAQSTIFAAGWEHTAGPDELVALAQAADGAGFFYVAACDHVAIPDRLAPAMSTTWYDPVATLGLLAGVTEQIRLMTHVWILAYRHPLQSAKSLATLDHLSKGRLIVGVGAGHVAEEFDMLGLDFARRGALLDERIDALKAAFTDEFVGGMGIRPRPAQRPRPPIWVGGSSPAAIRRAAMRGDGWLPQGTLKKDMPGQIAELRRLREEAGIAEPCTIGAISGPVYVGEPPWDCGPTLKGDPERIAAYLRGYRDMGVAQVQVSFRSRSCDEYCDQMRVFGEQVAPLL